MIRAPMRHLALFVVALTVSSCGQDQPAPQVENAPAAPIATAQAITPPATETPVRSIESVMVTRPQEAPHSVLIQVSGVVGSSGWTGARLVPIAESNSGLTKSFSLVARSPASERVASKSEIVEAELRLDAIPAGTEMIRIVGATNEVSAFMP